MNEYIDVIVALCGALAAIIPMVVKLVQTVRECARAKNWGALVHICLEYMAQAETNFDNGADRKEWVVSMVEQMAKSMNFETDVSVVGDLVDSLCAMSKKVNVPALDAAPANK